MGACCQPTNINSKSNQIENLEVNAHVAIENNLIQTKVDDSCVKKLLLLGTGSSGKSTIVRHWRCVLKEPFSVKDQIDFCGPVRRSCVTGIGILLKKTQELYELDNVENETCYLDISKLHQLRTTNNDMWATKIIDSIEILVRFQSEPFDYEYAQSYLTVNNQINSNGDNDSNHNIINVDQNNFNVNGKINSSNIETKKKILSSVGNALMFLWSLQEIKITLNKKKKFPFSFCENMEYFFEKMDQIFSWNYQPTTEDILRCRLRTSGIVKEIFETEQCTLHIYDVGGQRNERKKWIHSFDNVTALLFVAGLDHYATVLFEDEKVNAMIESLDLFYEILNSKWFLNTDVILFLNKEDIFDDYILNDVPLSFCFNSKNGCVYKDDPNLNFNLQPKQPQTIEENAHHFIGYTETSSFPDLSNQNNHVPFPDIVIQHNSLDYDEHDIENERKTNNTRPQQSSVASTTATFPN